MKLTTTEIYTRVALTKLKQVHTATHPAAPLRGGKRKDGSDRMEGMTDEGVIGAALAMSDRRRAHLAHLLYTSLDDEPAEQLTQAEWEEAWVEEAERRLADMREGKVKGIPGDQVFASVRDLLRP